VMKGVEDGKDRYALSENYRGGFSGRMIRTAQWKYFFYTNGDEYLYDMQTDPDEERNLVQNPDYRKTADELKARAVAGWKLSSKPAKKVGAGGKVDQPAKTGDKKIKQKKEKGG
jgi:arylsulfatase A-like enzyme